MRQAVGRAEKISCGRPLRRRLSGGENVEEQEAVVWVRRSDWARVMERDELVGRLRAGSRFPQYLDVAVSGVEEGWEWMALLYNCNVHGRSRAGAVDFLFCHCYL